MNDATGSAAIDNLGCFVKEAFSFFQRRSTADCFRCPLDEPLPLAVILIVLARLSNSLERGFMMRHMYACDRSERKNTETTGNSRLTTPESVYFCNESFVRR